MPDLTYPVPTGTLPGYLAVPQGTGPWPAVVVLHEIFGLTDDIRRQADRFAEHGYLALAPDLFAWGNKGRCLVASFRAMLKGEGRIYDDVEAARRYLADRDNCTGRSGVVGFCFGGGLAMLVAPRGFEVAAPNYGQLPRKPAQRLKGTCPTVASYGAKDISLKGAAAKHERVLAELGVEHDVKEYPEAKHAFMFPHSGRAAALTESWFIEYDAAAADDAWQRIFAFFDARLTADGSGRTA
jgi:carboxymethylenebutenolidase